MDADQLARKFGGVPVANTPPKQVDPDELARQFGGAPVATQQQDPDALAKQFGGVPVAAEQKAPEKLGVFDQTVVNLKSALAPLTDLYTKTGIGATAGVRYITDTFGADNAVSQSLRGVEGYLERLLSAQSKQDSKEIAAIMKEAQDKGAGEQIQAALKAFSVAPLDMLYQAAGTSVPTVAGGLAAGALKLPAMAGSLATGLATGAGVVKGAIYEETKKALTEAGTPADQAEARAVLAQEYGGKNLDQILLGTALGGLAATTGVESVLVKPTIRRILGEKAATRAGAEVAEQEVKKGVLRRMGETGLAEAIPETLQGSQEQYARNLALQREGFDVPEMRGVVGQGALEGIAGLGVGAPVGAFKAEDIKVEGPGDVARREALRRWEEEGLTSRLANTGRPGATLTDALPPTSENLANLPSIGMQSVVDDNGNALDVELGVSPSAVVTDTELEKLRNEYEERQAKIEAGTHPNIPAARRKNEALAEQIAKKEAELAEAERLQTEDVPDFTAPPTAAPGVEPAAAPSVEPAAAPTEPVVTALPPPDTSLELPPISVPPAAEAAQVGAEQGVPDVSGQVDQGAAGVGVPVSSGPGAVGAPSVPARVEPAGMVGSEELVGELTAGTEAQPTSLTPYGEVPGAVAEPIIGGAPQELDIQTTPEAAPAPAPEVFEPTTRRIEIPQPQSPAMIIPYSQGALDYLNLPSYYGANVVPNTPERGVQFAAAEQAFDDFDTIAYQEGVLPELTRLAAERNKAEGTNKYVPGRPLEFMTEQELVDLYKQKVGGRTLEQVSQATEPVGGGGKKRLTQADNRQEFLQTLDPDERAEYQRMYDQKLRDEIVNDVTRRERKREALTEEEKAERRAKMMQEVANVSKEVQAEQKAITDVEQQIAQGQQTEEQQAAEAERQALAIERRGRAPKVRARISPRVQQSIANGSNALTVLTEIANDKLYNSVTRVVAQGLLNLTKSLNLDVKIRFGTVEDGADGKFDPATNTITLQGTPGDFMARKSGAYTGKRSLDRVVLHEVMHYLTDHVIDNTEAYLKTIADPVKRAGVKAAITRLKANYALAKGQLGDRFDIPTIKEFIAETYSNPEFQTALGKLRTPQPYKQKGGFFSAVARNIANALGFFRDADISSIGGSEAGVALKEALEDIAQIISLPDADLRGAEVSYAGKQRPPKKAGMPQGRTNGLRDNRGYEPKPTQKTRGVADAFKEVLNNKVAAGRKLATAYQNQHYPIKVWQNRNDMAGVTQYLDPTRINDIYTEIVLGSSLGKNNIQERVEPVRAELESNIAKLASQLKMNTDETIGYVHRLMEAQHERERRFVKYLLTVPLSTAKTLAKGRYSPADYRAFVIKELDSRTLTEQEARFYRRELEKIIRATNPDGSPKYLDTTKKPEELNFENDRYNVIGLGGKDPDTGKFVSTKEVVDRRINEYLGENTETKAAIDAVLANVKELNDITTEFNKEARYWSDFVSNRVAFYNYAHYAPFKGRESKFDKHSALDMLLEFDSDDGKGVGDNLQDAESSFEGRRTIANNPILQSVFDANRAAMRAGNKNLTLAIKNSLAKGKYNPTGQGILPGKVVANVPFLERNKGALDKYRGPSFFYHYNTDGSIDILKVDDSVKRDAIRNTFKTRNIGVEALAGLTSFAGKMHTRLNLDFPAYNYVRDTLTNIATIGSEFGPKTTAKLIGVIAADLTYNFTLPKAMYVAAMYELGKFDTLRNSKDPVVKNIVEYILEGGLTSYIQALSMKSAYEQINKSVDRNGFVKTAAAAGKLLDMWIAMFEISARAAGYKVIKAEYLGRGYDMDTAKKKAAFFAKELANFEQIGNAAKGYIGAAYMFFRPSMTGAVRSTEALAPAFMNYESVKQEFTAATPYMTPEQRQKALDEYKQKQLYARIASGALVGSGMLLYVLSYLSSDDDDLGRNQTATDNMAQWVRAARFHIPESLTKDISDKPVTLNIPYGFGPGALASIGAQIAGFAAGASTPSQLVGNSLVALLDSFFPIPVSRINPTESWKHAGAWLLDTAAPSVARPMVEGILNINGFGQQIYSVSQRRLGDAYMGGDYVPDVYHRAAQWMYTNDIMDVSPNMLFFLSNSYADGVGRLIEVGDNLYRISAGEKGFTPKEDLAFFRSFFGTRSTLESRQFPEYEKKVREIEERLKTLKLNDQKFGTDKLIEYKAENPLNEGVVRYFNEKVNGRLNRLRERANKIRADGTLDSQSRDQLLRANKMEQDLEKETIMWRLSGYGIEP